MTFNLVAAGDSTLVVELDARIDPEINARPVDVAHGIRLASLPGVRDVVSTYHTVAVYFDPLRCDPRALETDVARVAASASISSISSSRTVDIPVLYGGDAGPDLDDVAAFARCPADEVIARHAGSAYRVYMLGFAPGFAYMGTVDARIAMPRRSSPRVSVPARTVGIAGAQTGVYPNATPGGWQLIGRTPVALFNPHRDPPCLLSPGDTVRFHPITLEDYELRLTAAGLQDA